MNKSVDAWRDLIDALNLLSTGRFNDVSPFHCEHDQLTVLADPAKFTEEELKRLEGWGFVPDAFEPFFYSFRYGSA